MKKLAYVLIVTLVCLSFSALNGQEKLGFGIKAGINIADQVTTGTGENVNVSSIMRFHGGVYGNFFVLNKIAIQPELLLSGKGSEWDDPMYNVKDLLTYIDVPVLIRYQPFDFLNVHAGPQFGYLLSAIQKDNSSGDRTDIDDYYEKADIGLVIGAEANLPFRINLTVRYVLGLIPTSTDVEYIEPWLNNFFQISAGFRIRGK